MCFAGMAIETIDKIGIESFLFETRMLFIKHVSQRYHVNVQQTFLTLNTDCTDLTIEEALNVNPSPP